MREIYWLGLLVPMLGGILSIMVPHRQRGWIAVLSTGLFSLGMMSLAVVILYSGTPLRFQLNAFQPLGQVPIVVDALSAFFILMIGLVSLTTSLYSISYLKNESTSFSPSHYFFLNMLEVSMILVVSIQHLVAFLIAWEFMSIASFFLVGYDNDSEQVRAAAINYLIATHLSLVFLMAAYIILSINTDSDGLWALTTLYRQDPGTASLVFVLAWIGFGLKAGFFPFHTWLPQAHPAAPSHVSAIMSGIMIKTGIYGILRLVSLIQAPSVYLGSLVLGAGLISGIVGIAYSLAQRDLKRSLAYSSIENIGIIGIGIGIGMLGIAYRHPAVAWLGFGGSLLHTLNHSLFKPVLFMTAGAVYRQTHTRDMEKMGGLARNMPITAAFFLIASVAICGLPPLNGFISELMIYLGFYQGIQSHTAGLWIGSVIGVISLALIGALSLFSFVRSYSMVFQGFPRYRTEHRPQEAPYLMRISIFPLILGMLLIGLLPHVTIRLIRMPLSDILPGLSIPETLINVMPPLSYLTAGLIILCLILYGLRRRLISNRINHDYKTWDCGYQAPSARMQYTATSFADPVVSLFSRLYALRDVRQPVEGLFPRHASFGSIIHDWLEEKVLNPILSLIRNAFGWLHLFQSGQTQQYILYGLILLLLVIIWIIGAL